MPSLRTEVTEIVTGLAMLGYQSLDRALEVRPRHITHVDDEVFERLEEARRTGQYEEEFRLAWDNGMSFARSDQGLRGRPPWLLEWKGPHKPACKSIETIPADLRIDHVFLISCKYGSEILHNSSPAQLIDHHLQAIPGQKVDDWYQKVAPAEYKALWEPAYQRAGIVASVSPSSLGRPEREQLRNYVRSNQIDTDSSDYEEFVAAVSTNSADRWRRSLKSKPTRQELLWRLLRMQAAPYYLLGTNRRSMPLRYRVTTPWDFTRRYALQTLAITPGARRQPSVNWVAEVLDKAGGSTLEVGGYVEIRWSHGKLQGVPEAKVHMTTNPHQVPGYVPLEIGNEE